MAEIINEEEFDKLLESINNILDIKESWYDFYLIDTDKGYEVDDFVMPNGMSLISTKESIKSIIAIDHKSWKDSIEATNEKDKRRHYAKFARFLSHELMHLHQYKYSFEKYHKDFAYENKLPKNTDKWTVSQRKIYDNLPVELEALAFGALVESTILQRKRSSLYTFTNRYQYKKVYSKVKDKYKKKVEEAFCKLS